MMKNIVIAAGYATRLGELTKNFPKPLLKKEKKSILGRMLEDIDSIPEIDEHIIIHIGLLDGKLQVAHRTKTCIIGACPVVNNGNGFPYS